jgi:hypothetical protein
MTSRVRYDSNCALCDTLENSHQPDNQRDYEHDESRSFAARNSVFFGYRHDELLLLLWGTKGPAGQFFFTFVSSSATFFLKSSLGQLLTELGPVGVIGDELLEDDNGLGARRLRVLRPLGVAEHVSQVEEVLCQFQTKLRLVGVLGELLPLEGDGLAEGRLRFLRPVGGLE